MTTRVEDRGPWIDVHGHAGRCFLGGLDAGHPLISLLGAVTTEAAFVSMRAGRVTAASVATVADLAVLGIDSAGGLCADRPFDPGEARVDHDRQLRGITGLLAGAKIEAVLNAADIEAAHHEHRSAAIICCEGADFCDGEPDALGAAHRAGVRSIGLVHYRVNELGDVQTEPPRHGGLTAFGADVVHEMNRLRMVIDLAHATFETTIDALEISAQPVMISHSHLTPAGGGHPRLLSEEHARAVGDAGGLVGAWPAGVVLASLDDFAAEIARMVDLLGVGHVAVGTDMDANYLPVLDRYEQFPSLDAALEARGFDITPRSNVIGSQHRSHHSLNRPGFDGGFGYWVTDSRVGLVRR